LDLKLDFGFPMAQGWALASELRDYGEKVLEGLKVVVRISKTSVAFAERLPTSQHLQVAHRCTAM